MLKTLWRGCKVWPPQTQHHSRHPPYVSAFSRFNSSVVWDFRKYWFVASTNCIYAGWYNSSSCVDCTLYGSCRTTQRINTSTRLHSFPPLCLRWESSARFQQPPKCLLSSELQFWFWFFGKIKCKTHIPAWSRNPKLGRTRCRPFIYGTQPCASQF